MAKKLISLFLLLVWLNAFAVDLNPDHPNRYVVQRGDTLWHIARIFLKDPWDWPKIWVKNMGVNNPNYIYPGDVLVLHEIDGQPKIVTAQRTAPQESKTIILKPHLRAEKISDAILTIPLNYLKPFLSRDRIFSENEFENAPYVLAMGHEDLIQAGKDEHIFIRGLKKTDESVYSLYKKGIAYHDKNDEDKILAYQGIYVGEVQMLNHADPATFLVLSSRRVINKGDRLFAREELLPPRFLPQAPKKMITGNIIGLANGLTQIGQYDVVALNVGTKQGVRPGDVFNIFVSGRRVTDNFTHDEPVTVQLPDHKVGILMVFKTYNAISYALVMKATQAFSVGAAIKSAR